MSFPSKLINLPPDADGNAGKAEADRDQSFFLGVDGATGLDVFSAARMIPAFVFVLTQLLF